MDKLWYICDWVDWMTIVEKNLLNIFTYHLGKDKAERYVKKLVKKLGIDIPKGNDYKKDFSVDFNGAPFSINFANLIKETQEQGVPKILQFIADSLDIYLRPTIPIAIGEIPKGLKISIGSQIGQEHESVQAPGFMESAESSLANDILYFRRMVCLNSSMRNAEVCGRYFRSYLLACVSLVDCFLARYINVVKEHVNNIDEYENTSTLASTSGIEKRIDAWFKTFAFHEIENYKENSTEWLYFQRIRNKRNSFVHPSKPFTVYSIKDMEKYLNYCNKGIGGLLENFRVYSGAAPDIGFIQKIKTAPKVTFNN
jgi:hypothetical protein